MNDACYLGMARHEQVIRMLEGVYARRTSIQAKRGDVPQSTHASAPAGRDGDSDDDDNNCSNAVGTEDYHRTPSSSSANGNGKGSRGGHGKGEDSERTTQEVEMKKVSATTTPISVDDVTPVVKHASSMERSEIITKVVRNEIGMDDAADAFEQSTHEELRQRQREEHERDISFLRTLNRSASETSSPRSSPNSIASSPRSSSLGRNTAALHLRGSSSIHRGSAASSRRGSTASSQLSSSDEVISEQEQSWLRISGIQMRRVSQGHDGLRRHVDTLAYSYPDASTVMQAARKVSILAKMAETEARQAADEHVTHDDVGKSDRRDLRADSDAMRNTSSLSLRRKVSTIIEDMPRHPEAAESETTTREKSRGSENSSDGDIAADETDANDDAETSSESRTHTTQMNVGQQSRQRWFSIANTAHHQLVRCKTQDIMNRLVLERLDVELPKRRWGANVKPAQSETRIFADAMRRRSQAESPTQTREKESVFALTVSSARNLYYSVQLQALLFARQFTHGVTRGDVEQARKSFIRKHALPCDFQFLTYTLNSVDEDLAEVIEVHWIEWVVGMLYLFGVGVDDVFAFQFWSPLLGLLLISLVGLQIQNVMFHVAALRIDDQHTTDSHFWFGMPRNMLWMLRISTSVFSFTLAFTYFVVWKEGLDSCYFDLWNMSWGWVVYNSILSFAGIGYIGYILMPQYSLAVEMGSFYRKDVLRHLLAESKVKKSEQDAQDELDAMHARSELNAKHSDEGFLMRQRRFDSTPTDGAARFSGDGMHSRDGNHHHHHVSKTDLSGSPARMPKRGVNNTEWCRHAAATYIQKVWKRTRE